MYTFYAIDICDHRTIIIFPYLHKVSPDKELSENKITRRRECRPPPTDSGRNATPAPTDNSSPSPSAQPRQSSRDPDRLTRQSAIAIVEWTESRQVTALFSLISTSQN